MIRYNPIVSLGNVDCSLYTQRNAPKIDDHKKRMDMLLYTLMKFNYLETLAKTFSIPTQQNRFFQKNVPNNAPVRRGIAIVTKLNSTFSGSHTKKSFSYQHTDHRPTRKLSEGQPSVDFDSADSCRL